MNDVSREFMVESARGRYSYGFSWMGVPCIQYPQDLWMMGELIHRVRPGAVVETGVAHGGSLLFYSAMVELVRTDAVVVGVDIRIWPHNRAAIEGSTFGGRVALVEASSVGQMALDAVTDLIGGASPVIVCLDSNHSHAHVLRELELYSQLVKPGGYIVVFDTVVENLPGDCAFGKPWGPGNSPATAVREFLAGTDRFVVDEEIDQKLWISVAPGGYLRCVK